MFQGNMGGFSGPTQHTYPAQPYEAPQPMQAYPYYAQDQMQQRVQGMQPYINQAQMYGYNPMQMYAAYNPYAQQSSYYPYQSQVPYAQPVASPQVTTPQSYTDKAEQHSKLSELNENKIGNLPEKMGNYLENSGMLEMGVQMLKLGAEKEGWSPSETAQIKPFIKDLVQIAIKEAKPLFENPLFKSKLARIKQEFEGPNNVRDELKYFAENKISPPEHLRERIRNLIKEIIPDSMLIVSILNKIVKTAVNKPQYAAIKKRLIQEKIIDESGKLKDVTPQKIRSELEKALADVDKPFIKGYFDGFNKSKNEAKL